MADMNFRVGSTESSRPAKNSTGQTCYACTAPATTREHAPPLSFFPKGYRDNLITVPSCEDHNNANAMDVEYVRNVISTMLGNNTIAEQHFFDKAIRSFDHTPALLHTTFSDIRPVQIQGQTIGVFTTDTDRVERVMAACVRALHFRETGERIYDWAIVLPNMGFSSHNTTEAEAAVWREFLLLFRLVPWSVQETGSPRIFQFAIGDIEGGRVYSLRFYESFVIFALVKPTDAPVEV
jgi:hypothetical protein